MIHRLGRGLLARWRFVRMLYCALRSLGTSKKIRGRNNHLDISEAYLVNCELVMNGNNNSISIGRGSMLNGVRIIVRGDNHRLSIGDKAIIDSGSELRMHDRNGTLEIGDHSTIICAYIQVAENNGVVRFGKDVMVSKNVSIMCSDSHAMFDQKTGERINTASNIEIGDHVWLGINSVILKGVTIGSGSVVGASSVVTKHVPCNDAVVGNPARVVRQGVTWTRERGDVILPPHS